MNKSSFFKRLHWIFTKTVKLTGTFTSLPNETLYQCTNLPEYKSPVQLYHNTSLPFDRHIYVRNVLFLFLNFESRLVLRYLKLLICSTNKKIVIVTINYSTQSYTGFLVQLQFILEFSTENTVFNLYKKSTPELSWVIIVDMQRILNKNENSIFLMCI